MTRVLLLTASYGSGHNIAAQSLRAAFVEAGAAVTVVDHFRDLVHPLFERASRALYLALLRWAPVVWGAAYAVADHLASDSPLTLGVPCLGTLRLGRLLDTLAPDAVVSVHATPAVALAALGRRGRRLPPHTTVVTDFVAHSQWIVDGVDRYCVAADEVRHQFISRGIWPDRILVTGLPVRPEFEKPLDPLAARQALGLALDRPVVLVMAGSHGRLGRLPEATRVLLGLAPPVQGIVVAGADAGLQACLLQRTAGTSVRVLAATGDVRRLMAAADLLVTKAGGMTLAEALAAEVPLVTFGSLPGQERRNEAFASRVGVALVARSPHELRRTLERALAEGELVKHLRERIRLVRRPGAARAVVDAVLEPLRSR